MDFKIRKVKFGSLRIIWWVQVIQKSRSNVKFYLFFYNKPFWMIIVSTRWWPVRAQWGWIASMIHPFRPDMYISRVPGCSFHTTRCVPATWKSAYICFECNGIEKSSICCFNCVDIFCWGQSVLDELSFPVTIFRSESHAMFQTPFISIANLYCYYCIATC